MIFNKVLFEELNENQKKLMIYLKKNSKSILQDSIIKVSEKNNVSPSFVTKTLKKMGFFGWKDYRAFIMAQMIIPKINVGYMKYLEKNLFPSIKASIANINEMKIFEIASEINKTKGDLVFVGEGFSFYIAKDQCRRYNKHGFRSFPVNPLNAEYKSFRNNDTIFLISISGLTKSILQISKFLKDNKIKYYLLTMNPNFDKIHKNVIAGRMHDSENHNEREYPKISRLILLTILDWIYTKFQTLRNLEN